MAVPSPPSSEKSALRSRRAAAPPRLCAQPDARASRRPSKPSSPARPAPSDRGAGGRGLSSAARRDQPLSAARAARPGPAMGAALVRAARRTDDLAGEGRRPSRARGACFSPRLRRRRVEPDVVIVPLVFADRTGTRIGHGKGHYDRALAHLRAGRAGLRRSASAGTRRSATNRCRATPGTCRSTRSPRRRNGSPAGEPELAQPGGHRPDPAADRGLERARRDASSTSSPARPGRSRLCSSSSPAPPGCCR